MKFNTNIKPVRNKGNPLTRNNNIKPEYIPNHSYAMKDTVRGLALNNLYFFLELMWDTFEPHTFTPSWYLEYMCECFMYSVKHFLPAHVQKNIISDEEYEKIKKKEKASCDVRDKKINGQNARRHNLNICPRHTKSIIFNIAGPIWVMLNAPVTIMSISHSKSLSAEFTDKKRKIVNHEKYQYYFNQPQWKLIKDTAEMIQLLNGGKSYSVNMKRATGFGADIIIGDDILAVEDIKQAGAHLRTTIRAFRSTLPSRLNSRFGVKWNIAQRVGKGDITDIIFDDKGMKSLYTHTEMHAIARFDQSFIFPVTGAVKHVKKGDFLAPDRFGDYTDERILVGESDFETQYNQNPAASDLNVHKAEHFEKLWISDEEFNQFKMESDTNYASHDTAVKDKATSDCHGFVTAIGKNNELVITGGWQKKMAYSVSKQLMIDTQTVDPSIIQIVEDRANGAALLQDLATEVAGLVPFDPGTKSKTMRQELASMYVKQGLVRFVDNPETRNLVELLIKFPFAEYDDLTDAFAQLVIYHMTQRRLGVYAGAFNFENLTDPIQYQFRPSLTYGATIHGMNIKVVGVAIDLSKDMYTVQEEHQFNSYSAFEEFCRTRRAGETIYDATPNNRLASLVTNVFNLMKFNEKDREKSMSLMRSGFYKNKIKIYKECKQTINDIAKLRIDDTSREKGTDQTETLVEGFAGGLRAVITEAKGYSNQWY